MANNEFDNIDEFEEDEFEIITMTEDDGSEIELAIIDNVVTKNGRYLMVVEIENLDSDDDEADAFILKEEFIGEEDVTYTVVEDEKEFNEIGKLFTNKDGDYSILM